MNEQRPKPEQTKDQVAPRAEIEPSTNPKPSASTSQPKSPDSGSDSSRDSSQGPKPQDPMRVSTQGKR